MGFKLVAHPFALGGLEHPCHEKALEILKQNGTLEDRVSFQELKNDVDFDEYYREEERVYV